MLQLCWVYRWRALLVLGMQLVLLALMLTALRLIGLAIDVIKFAIDGQSLPSWPWFVRLPEHWSAMQQVTVLALMILVLASSRMFVDYFNKLTLGRMVEDIVVHLRSRVYNRLQRLSFRFFDANQSGSLINRVTGDVQAVRMFMDQVLIQVTLMLLTLTIFLIYMLSIHVALTIACLASTPLLIMLAIVFSKVVKPAYRQNRLLFDQTIRVLGENISGMHVVKGFALQQQQTQRFEEANRAVYDQSHWIFWRVSTYGPLITQLTQFNHAVLLAFGGYLFVTDPAITLGTLVIFAGLLGQFSAQMTSISQISNSIQRSLIGAQRVFEVLDAPVEIQSLPSARTLGQARGDIVFDQVTFGYKSDQPVLQQVSFSVAAGKCIALLGATGSGKSTLLSLIPRFYDPQEGSIRIDGHDLRDLDLDNLRRNVGLVFQESFLFSNTVAANIAFGHPEATREQIQKAARIAAIDDFISSLPDGYDTIIGERGTNLSGGQRQRLAIARAVLLEPSILLMDDPTAAIDPETEDEILQAMDTAMQGRTSFIVAHRLSTLRRADQIIVLDQGRVVETGTHDELITADGHYQNAVSLQSADPESRRVLGYAPHTASIARRHRS